jgi:hypothetical protein
LVDPKPCFISRALEDKSFRVIELRELPNKMSRKRTNREPLFTILGQPSWRLASTDIEAHVTRVGGHLGPVTFDRQHSRIQPFSVAPWHKETLPPSLPPMIRVLRGDFFCAPFGGNQIAYKGERHPPHGETANAAWTFKSLSRDEQAVTLHVSLQTKIRRGRVDKIITLKEGHPVLYCRHVLSGMSGPMNLGHHAMIAFPAPEASGRLSTSPFVHGQVYPGLFEDPAKSGYSCLKPGAIFTNLAEVPMADGSTADLTRFPARAGFEDLVMLVTDRSRELAWNAVTFPKQRYVWFALRNPQSLAETVLWISNRGRHYPPWSGRHGPVMGIEDLTSYFGLAESVAKNPISALGHPTFVRLNKNKPTTINYVMGCVKIPARFDVVNNIEFSGEDTLVLSANSGMALKARVDSRYLQTVADPEFLV